MADDEKLETNQEDSQGRKSRPKRQGRRRRKAAKATEATEKRGRGPTSPFPPVSFLSVLPLAEAIQKHGAGQATRRITIFDKLGKSPESSASRMLITNSSRYGVTTGGYQAEVLELTPLGAVATSPDSPPREKAAARFKLAVETVPAFKHLYERREI